MDFEKEISELYPWLLRVAKRFCTSLQDAEDLAGETVYKVLLNRGKFKITSPLKPWCITVMKNTYITHYNRNALIQFTGYDFGEEKMSLNSTSDTVFFNDLLFAIKRCAQKSCCIDCVIYYAKGYSYDEISELLHIPIGTVRSRISSGRKCLQKEIDGRYGK